MYLLAEPSRSPAYWARPCYSTGLVEGCNPSTTISPPQFTCEQRSGLNEFVGQARFGRLSFMLEVGRRGASTRAKFKFFEIRFTKEDASQSAERLLANHLKVEPDLSITGD
ncbi:hypothetical protein DY000_02033947 [Brassica cretica]|uniref:RRM domain-containing protein n=1 Tax=Brassica cretica TaxID=69181 RepID=A0ABQ7DI51_BRACR|nr:hypothetical protein DY000_02033947 [Brassica cretica]